MADLAPGELVFVIGGARSGKSAYALELARAYGGPVIFLATATVTDEEMAERVRRHQRERPAAWHTIEEPLELAVALEREAPPGALALVDCLTVWLGNLLHRGLAEADHPTPREVASVRESALGQVEALCGLPRSRRLALLVVSNEVGLGVVPATPLGRLYRDLLGEVNQRVAAAAGRVVWMVAGLPVTIKGK